MTVGNPGQRTPGWLLGPVAVPCQLNTVSLCQQAACQGTGRQLSPSRLLLLPAHSSPPADKGARCPKALRCPSPCPPS